MTNLPQRFADVLTTYSKSIILLVLVLTVLIGLGVPMVESDSDIEQFESDSPAANAQAYIQQNLTAADTENQTRIQVIQRGDNVLSKEAILESLQFQEEIRDTESINQTLDRENPFFGVENIVGTEAFYLAGGSRTVQPTLDQQQRAVEQLPDEQYENLIVGILGDDGDPRALALMPSGSGSAAYEQGSTTAQARSTIITQRTMGGSVEGPDGFDPQVTEAQLAIRDLAQDRDFQYTVFGFAVITEEIDQSLGDSGAIVGPLALLFVVIALTVAYRDLVDIVLGVIGILLVLVWTFGFMGWTDVAFNQLLLSVPVLLIGLSIDYAIHVFMRHREQREEETDRRDLRRSMALALGGVGVALVWVTATAAIGFLANLTSPIGPLRDFGVVSAFGVFAALVIFGALVPALKIELDTLFERVGIDRRKRAFGTGESRFAALLSVGAAGARRFPIAIVALTLLITVAGAYGATQVDTSFQEEDFLADSPPDWTYDLPEPFKPGTYQAKNDLEFIQSNFQQEGNEGQLLVRGNVTNENTLVWLDRTATDLEEKESVFNLPNGEADVQSPLSVMRTTAARNPNSSFAQLYRESAGPNGVPDRNVEELFAALLEVNPQAAEYIYRNDAGEFEALRIVVGVEGNANVGQVTDDMRSSASDLESASDGELEAVATGDPIINYNVERDLFDTVIQGLLITLVAVFIFLSVAYRLTGNPASLGFVTLLPVVFSVSWILGSMWLLEIPFNALTGTITSLTIGLGIAYSIHVSSRYELELRRQGDVWDAMRTTVTGTGGALLGSAATTVGGFGTLVFAILPVLRQFGIITGLTIIYAFLASVLILPSLLVLWTRYLGPSGYFPEKSATGGETQETSGTDTPAADFESE